MAIKWQGTAKENCREMSLLLATARAANLIKKAFWRSRSAGYHSRSFWLGHAEPVAKWVFEDCFYAIKLFFGRRYKLNALGLHLFIGLAAISSLEDSCAECAFLHQFTDSIHIFSLDSLHASAVKW